MKQVSFILFTIMISHFSNAQYHYPASKIVDSSDTWHNITIKDAYRWMEDLKSDETANWFKAQNDFTESLMNKLPMTNELYKGFLMLDSIQPDKVGKVRQVGNTLFYFNQKLDESKMKVCKRNGEFGKEEVIAEYLMWGKNYQIRGYEIDPYQKYIVITAAEGGRDFAVAKFYDLVQNKFLTDSVPGNFAGFAPGEGNVYYAQQPTWDVHVLVSEKDKSFKIHKLGTDTLQDKIFLSYITNPELYSTDDSYSVWPVWVDKDADYEFIQASSVSPYSEIYYRKINSNTKWKKIISIDDEITTYNGIGSKLYYVTKKNATNGKIMFLNMSNPDITKATLVVPEKNIPLESNNGLLQSKNYIILPYMKNGVVLHNDVLDMRTNKVAPVKFPENTNLTYITPFNKNNDDVHIARTGWTNPNSVTYSNLDKPFANEKIFSFRRDAKYPYTNEITVDEIEIPGHDGVLIPISIIHRKDVQLNGQNVAYVYSYGAYGISSTAGFNPEFLLLAHKGIVLTVAHVRGGGEKGESWHLGGYKQSKPNTWKDLNSTAEYLINKGYTTSAHLACEGGSAGGILIGRAITERPDLWACAVPQVGCLSMVRQEFAPNGPINTPEFGTVTNINEFFSLMEMDALLHVQDSVKYPALLITTGWNDPRVISWQPGKFAAAVQKSNSSDKPILLQVDYTSGHGDSEDKFAALKKEAKKWAFILEQTGYKK